MYKIEFTFEEKHKPPLCIENVSPDQSILDVALDNDIALHHNCGGVCACSTCQIYIEFGECFLQQISDKEETFIDRAKNPRINSRLACQSLLLEGTGTVRVNVPDQSIIQGE